MRTAANILIGLAAAALLLAMMLTNPDYNSALRPFVTKAQTGTTGQTRLISGRFDDWRVTGRIAYDRFGTPQIRETEGIFLIAELTLSGTSISTPVAATWVGRSQRRYRATSRIKGLPRQIDDLRLQPGLTSRTFAIFELPPDEIEGGALLLTLPLDPNLDGTLLLAPPATEPTARPVESFDP